MKTKANLNNGSVCCFNSVSVLDMVDVVGVQRV